MDTETKRWSFSWVESSAGWAHWARWLRRSQNMLQGKKNNLVKDAMELFVEQQAQGDVEPQSQLEALTIWEKNTAA
eukprot:6325134-Amphidinium_carterae.1